MSMKAHGKLANMFCMFCSSLETATHTARSFWMLVMVSVCSKKFHDSSWKADKVCLNILDQSKMIRFRVEGILCNNTEV